MFSKTHPLNGVAILLPFIPLLDQMVSSVRLAGLKVWSKLILM